METSTGNMQTDQRQPVGASAEGRLAGQVALVTGAASGLGAALCRRLAAAGAHLMMADLNSSRARELARSITEAASASPAASMAASVAQPPTNRTGDNLNACAVTACDVTACDVGDPAQAEYVVRQTIARFGAIDLLVNNAGTDVTCGIADLAVPQWERVLRTNLHGPFVLSRAAAAFMAGRGYGQIVNITSTAAKRAWPNAAAYHASKTGLLALSHAMHAELRPAGIKVTAVVVGGMATPFLLERFPDIDRETLQDPDAVARAICDILQLPPATVVPEITILPMRETSWP